MALVVFGEKIDFTSVDLPEQGGYVVGYDVNTGLLSQMDYLGNVTIIGTLGGGVPLTNTLALGNNTGTYSIVLDSSIIKGTNKLSLDNDTISFTTDNGGYNESYLYMNSGNAILGNGVSKSFRIESTGITTKWSDTNKQTINTNSYELLLNNLNTLQFGKLSSGAGSKLSALISTDNSTIANGLVNTIVIGGQNIQAVQSNSVYVPYLFIQDGKVIKGTKGSGQIKFTETGDVTSSNSNSVIGVISSTSSVIFTQNGIFVKDSATASSTPDLDSGITYIGTRNSSATASIKNSVIIGGQNMIATQDNTIYLGNNVNINNAYTLPTTDGTSNQILITDGSGNLSWGGGSQVSGIGSTNSVPRWTSTSTLGTSSITDDGTTTIIKDTVVFDQYGFYTNTLGINNLKFGYKALFNNTDGYDNISIGYNSLKTNFSNNKNIAIGNYALEGFSTGIDSFGTFTPGSGYIDGDYLDVPLKYISGSTFSVAPKVEIVVVGGVVNTVNIKTPGSGFIDETTILGVTNSYIGGTGSGFQIGINSLTGTGDGIDGVIAIGYNSLRLNQYGDANMAIGHESMRNNTMGYLNTAIGYKSMYSNTYGGSNVALGYKSMYSNINGHNNVALGLWSMYSNTYGGSNTAIGMESLYYNTLGEYNTAVGFESLLYNTTGNDNVAIGKWSLQSNTTGVVNTAIGNSSLFSNTIGTDNIAIGSEALLSNTIGQANLAIGNGALYSNVSGEDNIAIGNQALTSNISGAFNVVVGELSLNGNTTGYANTVLGFNALGTNQVGYNNIAIGYQAGPSGATNSINSIYIGYNSGSNSQGYSNEINIGSTMSYGTNSVVLGNTTTTKTILNGNISIGNSNSNGSKLFIESGTSSTTIGSNVLLTLNNSTSGIVGTLSELAFSSSQGTDPYNAGHIFSTISGYVGGWNNVYSAGGIIFSTRQSTGSSLTEKMRIDYAGNVMIGTSSSSSSAILRIDSTTQGVLVPRMTTTQINSISTPSEGLIVYNITLHQICFHNGTEWRKVTDSTM